MVAVPNYPIPGGVSVVEDLCTLNIFGIKPYVTIIFHIYTRSICDFAVASHLIPVNGVLVIAPIFEFGTIFIINYNIGYITFKVVLSIK